MDYLNLSRVLPKLPRKWNTDDILIWLNFINLEYLHSAFKQHSVDGSIIFTLTQDDLKHQIGVKSTITVKKIMSWIKVGLKQYTEFLASGQYIVSERIAQGGQQNNSLTRENQKKNGKVMQTHSKNKSNEKQYNIGTSINSGNRISIQTNNKCQNRQKVLIVRSVIDGVNSVAYQITNNGGKIGSNSSCTIVNVDSSVDSYHAQIFFEDGNFYAIDMGSKNGTFYKIQDRQQLHHGMILQLGSTIFQVFKKGVIVKLRVIQGGSISEQIYLDEQNRFTIGRKPENHIPCIEDHHMSNQHAQILKIGQKYYIQDLGSTNGTWERLSPPFKSSLPKRIKNRCTIRISQNYPFVCTIIDPDTKRYSVLSPNKCENCRYQQKNCLFIPCRHVVLCFSCSTNVSSCPLCFLNIETRKKIFQT